jgi:S1-C subfamily serine protease
VKNREMMESGVGKDLTIASQLRSKEILNEIASAKSSQPLTTNSSESAPKSSGSGAIVSTQGLVLTAAHVVAGANRVQVYTVLGMRDAKVLRVDEANDIAILQIADGSYPALPIAPPRLVRLGQVVATIGFPNMEVQGFSPKVTRGEISSLNGIGDDPRSWQISVPVQPGNTGGPLLDENGNLVGIIQSKPSLEAARTTNDLPQNVSYSVKSSYALALLDPYLNDTSQAAIHSDVAPRFEDMVAKAQQSVVLILVY